MKKTYQTKRTPLLFLSALVVLLLIGPPLISHCIDADPFALMLANIVIYIAYSPLIILLIYVIIKNFKTKIIITGDGIEWTSFSKSIMLQWHEVDYFVFDYVRSPKPVFSPERCFTIYELGGKSGHIRFRRLMTDAEIGETPDCYEIKPFRIKSFSFDAYGMHLGYRTCQTLRDYIRDYTEREPERKRELF
jgi:hypothetical protein